MNDSDKKVSVSAYIDAQADISSLQQSKNLLGALYDQLKNIEATKKRIGSLTEKDAQTEKALQAELTRSASMVASLRTKLEAGREGVSAAALDLMTPQSSIASQLGLSERARLAAGAHAAARAADIGTTIRNMRRAEARAAGTEDELPENIGRGTGGGGRVMRALLSQFPMLRGMAHAMGGVGGGAGAAGMAPTGGGGGGIMGAIGAIGGPVGLGAIVAAGMAVKMMYDFAKESVQYWNQIQRSSMTLATNMGTTASEMERTHNIMLDQGRGLGFKIEERQQIAAAVMRGGFRPEAADATMNIARFLGMEGGQTAGFHAEFGRSVGARRGGQDPFMRIAAAMIPAGMAHDPQAYLQAMAGAFQQSASVMGTRTTAANADQIARYMAGIQATSVGEGAMGTQFSQEIRAGMQNPIVQMMLFDELRRKHPDWDYLKIQDAIRNQHSPENVEAIQAVSRRAGGGGRGQELILSELFGFSEEKRQEFMNLKFPDILSESQSRAKVFAGAQARMSTSGGLVTGREEKMSELMFAIGDHLAPAANKAADALLRVAGAAVGTEGRTNPLAPGGSMSMMNYLFNPFGVFSTQEQ